MKSAATSVASAASQAVVVEGIQVLAQRVDSLDRGQLRTLVDNLRNKLGSGVVVLGSAQEDGKVALIAGVTQGSDRPPLRRQNHRPPRAEGRRLRRRSPRHGRSRRQRRFRAQRRPGQRPRSSSRTAGKTALASRLSPCNEHRVPHISLVFREMWDTTAIRVKRSASNRG